MIVKLLTGSASVFIGITLGTAWAQPSPVTLLYTERPPFMYRSEQGSIVGSTATPAIEAFDKAGVAYEIKEASPARRLFEVKENKTRVCSIGWYKTREREAFAKFTKPVSQDSPMVALTSPTFHPPKGTSVDELLSNASTRELSSCFSLTRWISLSCQQRRRLTTASLLASKRAK